MDKFRPEALKIKKIAKGRMGNERRQKKDVKEAIK